MKKEAVRVEKKKKKKKPARGNFHKQRSLKDRPTNRKMLKKQGRIPDIRCA